MDQPLSPRDISSMTARSSSRLLRNTAACALVFLSLAATACVRQPTMPPKPAESETQAAAPVPGQELAMTPEAAQVYYYLMLDEAARNNDLRAGGKAIGQLLQLDPGVPVFLDAARFYGLRKEITLARDIAKMGLEKFPDHFDLTVLLAETYLEENRIDEAVGILRDLIARNPESADARLHLGQVLLAHDKFAEAADLLAAPSAIRSGPLTRYYLSRAYINLKKFRDAERELKAAVKTSPDFVEAWAELAFLYEVMKDYVAAEKTYERIIELGQAGQEVWLRLIALNIKLNRPDKALSIAKNGPEETGFHLQAATAFMEEGFNEHARELLEPLAEQNNPPAEVFFHLALIAFSVDKDFPRAVDLLENIPEHSPLWAKSARFRAQLLYEVDRKDEALQIVTQGRTSDPGDREFWDMEVDMLASMQLFEEAHATLDEALVRWPKDPELLFSKGSIYDLAGDKELAFKTMERVITIDPENPQALNYVGYTLADKGLNLERALVLIETALKQEPDKAYIVDSLAWVHYRLGNLEEAWEAINRCLSLGVEDPTIWEHYGDIAKAMGRKADARKGYREALKMNPGNADEIKKKLQEI